MQFAKQAKAVIFERAPLNILRRGSLHAEVANKFARQVAKHVKMLESALKRAPN